MEKVEDIWAEVSQYFKNHFLEKLEFMPNIDEVPPSSLSLVETKSLSVRFDLLEVNEVVVGMNVCKSLGIDGFNVEFYKRF